MNNQISETVQADPRKISGSLLAIYEAKLLQKNLSRQTIERRSQMLDILVRRGADLNDSLSVWRRINDSQWSNATKNLAGQAYTNFAQALRIPISEDLSFKWKFQRKLPFLPTESEIDQLISACSAKVATLLQLLKDSGARSGEVWRLRWQDIDLDHGILTINSPEKGSNPRQMKISLKAVAMARALPHDSEKVFGDATEQSLRCNFTQQRKALAEKVHNPRVNQIHFHTLRHWFASKIYHQTHNIKYVQALLGHRSLSSTEIYTQLIPVEGCEWVCEVAKTTGEARGLVEAGFEYVCQAPDGNGQIFRKRK